MNKNKTKGKANAIDILIGEKLKAKRLQCHLSQEELGTAMGVTFQQIQKYENGLNRLSASRLFIAAYVMDTDIVNFFSDQDGNSLFEKIKESNVQKDFQEIMDIFNCIQDNSLKNKLIKLMD